MNENRAAVGSRGIPLFNNGGLLFEMIVVRFVNIGAILIRMRSLQGWLFLPRNKWEIWETGALLWTALFAVYYLFTFPPVGKHRFLERGVSFVLAALIPSLVIGAFYYLAIKPKLFPHIL